MSKASERDKSPTSFLKKITAVAIVSMMVLCCLVITDSEETDAVVGPTSGSCGASLNWDLDTKTGHLTITGSGAMTDFPQAKQWGGNTVRSVSFPDGITTIGDYAFYECRLTSVTIPEGVTKIGDGAFYFCGSLSSVTLPESLTTIGESAFNSTKLTTVTIPKNVTAIGDYAFTDCNCLTSITVDGSNSAYSSVDGILFNKAKTVLIQYPAGKTGESYVVPNDVTEISSFAFSDSRYLKTVTIGTGVTTIGDGAFNGCTGLTSMTIPNNVNTISSYAFDNCAKMTSVSIGDGVINLPGGVFRNCLSLTTVTIGSNVATISDTTFRSCGNISSFTVSESNTTYSSKDGVLFNKDKTALVKYPSGKEVADYSIPSTVMVIISHAFDGCSHLRTVKIPESVTTISGAFECYNLERFIVSNDNMSYCSIDGILFNKTKTTLVQYPSGKTDESYTIPSSVTTIGPNAFANCFNLKSVTMPNTVTTIGPSAFSGSGLRTVHLPANVTFIDPHTFENCSELESFSVSSSNTSFCTIDGILYSKDKTRLISCPANYCGTVKIPNGTEYVYAFCSFSYCKGVTGFELEDDSPYYVENGLLFFESSSSPIAYINGSEAEKCELTNDVQFITPGLFLSAKNLKEITVEESHPYLTSKDGCVFEGNDVMIACAPGKTSVKIPAETRYISSLTFGGSNLEEVIFASGSNVIVSEKAFLNCSSLKKIVIEDGANVTFLINSVEFTDNKEHTIYVVAPEGFELSTNGFMNNIKVVYGEPPGNSLPWLYIGLGIAGVIILAGVTIILIRRHKNKEGKQ